MIRAKVFSLYSNIGRNAVLQMNFSLDFLAKHATALSLLPTGTWVSSASTQSSKEEATGSALIKPILAKIDKEHLPCYLETVNEKNVPVYQHYGFEVASQAPFQVPVSITEFC
jgi:hypothetical protein